MQTTNPESMGFSAQRLARINTVMQGYLDRDQLAGMITLVARRGQVVHLEKPGWMDREAGKPMEFDAIFRIYSMTKPIATAAVMMLYEECHFQLSDPISRFIPGFKGVKVYQPRGTADYDLVPPQREITIRDLLTHTSGLSYGVDPQSYVDDLYRKQLWGKVDENPKMSLAEAVELITKLPLAFHPGTAWRYSVAIDVLGFLVQVISGQPFETFLKERIFDPLGLVDTGFFVPPDKYDRLAAVYGPVEGGGIKQIEDLAMIWPYPHKDPDWWASGGGGLVSTTADYFRFAQMILNRGKLDGVSLLAPKTVDLMLMDHLPKGVQRLFEPFEGFGLGGSVLLDVPGSQTYGTAGSWGWGGAANTWFLIDPKEELLMILMLQYMPAWALPVDKDFKNMVYQALVD